MVKCRSLPLHMTPCCRMGLNYEKVMLYTIGSPRVGQEDFTHCVHNSMEEAWRMRTVRDVVATIPLSLGVVLLSPYRHVMPGL